MIQLTNTNALVTTLIYTGYDPKKHRVNMTQLQHQEKLESHTPQDSQPIGTSATRKVVYQSDTNDPKNNPLTAEE